MDPVRFISNRSTGKMGYAIAAAAARRGHDVHLVSGPVSLPPLPDVPLTRVGSADDMLAAVVALIPEHDALVMAAAVADWRPRVVSDVKLKKAEMSATLFLERTPDILETVVGLKGGRLFVGFAAETHAVLDEARRKLDAKGLDLIVANDISRPDAGFEVDTNAVTLVPRDGPTIDVPLMSKAAVADVLLDWVETQWNARAAHDAGE